MAWYWHVKIECMIYEIYQLKSKLEYLKNITPLDLGIHEKFSLNEKTRTFQENLLKIYNDKLKKWENYNISIELNNFVKDESKDVRKYDKQNEINIKRKLNFIN